MATSDLPSLTSPGVVNMRRSVYLAAVFAVACLACLAHPAFAQQTDIIRGRVTGPDTMPVKGVTVTATSYQGNVSKKAATDKNGRFTIIFVNGEGDYWLEFRAIGFTPKRFEIKRVGEEEIMIADTKMVSNIASLDAVNIVGQANRATPNRNANAADVGGGDRGLGNAGVPPDMAGNLAAMASAIPGIQLIPGMDGAADMFSALGLGGDQNNTSFNGLGSGISTLPPDAQVRVSFNQFPWDVSRGGFSGAGISISTIPGSNYSSRAASGYGTGPDLEWTGDNGEATGQKSTTLRLGGRAAGPITLDKRFYNGSYSALRRYQDALNLLNTSDVGLSTAGVARDSVTRLLDILRDNNVPATVARAPSLNATDNLGLQANFDLVPSSSGTGNAFTLGFLGNYGHSQPVGGGGSLLFSPGRTNQAENWQIGSSLGHSNYFWFGVLTHTTLGYSVAHSVSMPFLNYPQGSVRVNSVLPDGSSAVRNLLFGGGTPPSSSTSQTAQLTNQLTWYSANNKHTLKLASSVAREQNISDAANGTLGSFSFNSLADLEAGRPSGFSRTLSSTHAVTGQYTAGASFGDSWRPTPNVQVQYGVRLDANRFAYSPDLNPMVRDTFGIRNDYVPNKLYVSPRVGMLWYYGNAPTIQYAPGSARPPRAVIHAGAGIFQNIAGANQISGAVNFTGLPSSTQSISCVGPATPFPEWNDYLSNPGAIPTQCADGSAGTVFSNGAPSVVAFDRGYQQPRSFRTAADWSSAVLDNRFALGLQVVYSWNMNQQGNIDANLNTTPRFTLDNEGGRPVFADPTAVVPGTGTIASRASRVSEAFRGVSLMQSNLHSASRQLVVKLQPVTANQKLSWAFTYSLLDVRDQFRGFSSTVGDPFDMQWGPHLQSGKHQFSLTWNRFPIADLIFISAGVQVKSGQRFTPMIQGDVNGDLNGNDRAFVFDPATAVDPALATQMQSLLTSGSSAARSCLSRQLGEFAARGSCQAPWVANAGLSIQFNPQKIGLPKRASVVLSFTNPLVLADIIAHGSKDIRGWGQEIPADQNLLFVRGFDPATQRFKYEVNERFGSTRPQQSTSGLPAYISVSIGLDIGYTRERQTLTQRLDMGRGRPGTKQPAASLKQLATAGIPNPMAMILQQPDSLKLTRKQADSLASLSRKFTLHADSVWTPVSKYLEALPEGYDRDEAYSHYVKAREQTVDYLLTLVPDVRTLLTASQKRKLPIQVSNFLDDRVLKFMRSSSAGDASMYFIR